ncbi:hypothetical protein DAPK24_055600 [Pichia kluyveri]|uniref:Uncharacterized protein n=1 Tax=Pichia kluyveri TaxID=36015 RepID=A0AAV5RCN3_PICKL|nr:hypothetical protein DAPK24_055600 [Pichia kluyveri]
MVLGDDGGMGIISSISSISISNTLAEWISKFFQNLQLSSNTIKTLDSLSNLSGYMSISFWLFAQLPQVIKNFTDTSIEGFSLLFLICWFGGDLLNLISCLLNNAMMFQILLSSYYCIIDIILGFQYYYYTKMYNNPESKWYHPKQKNKHRHGKDKYINSPRSSLRDNLETFGSIDGTIRNELLNLPKYKTSPKIRVKGMFRNSSGNGSNRERKMSISSSSNGLKKIVSVALISSISKVQGMPIIEDNNTGDKNNNSILYMIIIFFVSMNKEQFGKLLAWICTFLYLVSRIPQIYTNYKIKSTSGISLKLIIFALFGNLFYSISLLICENSIKGGENSLNFWNNEISYFIGAMGTVIFDSMLIIQYFNYDYQINEKQYRISKSGKIKLISPKIDVKDLVYNDNNSNKNDPMNIVNNNNNNNIRNSNININPYYTKSTDPIEMSSSVKSTLSPKHIRKLSEFTPLSPMDFLIDDYMASIDNNNNK